MQRLIGRLFPEYRTGTAREHQPNWLEDAIAEDSYLDESTLQLNPHNSDDDTEASNDSDEDWDDEDDSVWDDDEDEDDDDW